MLPLYHEHWYTFRFGDDRRIPRFHLEGLAAGTPVRIHAADPVTLQPVRLLASAIVGEAGWVDVEPPLLVRAGEVFLVFPVGAP